MAVSKNFNLNFSAKKFEISGENTNQVALLLGGEGSFEGDVVALNEQLVFGSVCDVGFGYNEVINVSELRPAKICTTSNMSKVRFLDFLVGYRFYSNCSRSLESRYTTKFR